MITTWLKIIYYKITKLAPRLRTADPGTAPHTGARATTDETSPEVSALLPVTMNGIRLRELYERGLIWIQDVPGMTDVVRMDALHQDREQRERAARTDASRCPCGGRHYPEPDACRWCRCHDPRSVHHRPDAPGIMQVIQPSVRPSAEIERCGVCRHPHHGVGERACPGSVPSGEPSGGIESCRCDGTRIREYSITDEAVDAAWDSFLGINPDGVEGGPS